MNTISHYLKKIKSTYLALSIQKVLFIWILLFLSLCFLVASLVIVNNKLVVTIPKRGGTIEEGIIGTPRFINPTLATSPEDEMLASLVFAGLTKIDENNKVVLSMASFIEKSEDSLNYTVTLKEDVTFHDGQKLTADDVLFTISLIQNPSLKSPQKIKWEGVKVEKLSDDKILFTLKQPYPLFERSLAIGILPKHIWKNLSQEELALSDLNVNAIGSGPYKITKIDQVSGIPRVFTLKENKNYSLGRPYIPTIIVHSYKNEKLLEQAFTDGKITNFATISTLLINKTDDPSIIKNSMILPQTFSLFFNANKNTALADKDVRRALSIALHKETLIKTVFGDGAVVASTQYPFEEETYVEKTDDPQSLIAKSSWRKKNATTTLAMTLTIGDSEENRKLATAIKEKWDAIGAPTRIAIFEFSDLNQKIKNRDFEAVLSGTLIEDVSDLYAFWHSSQRTFPGLNISNYASTKMDQNLESLRSEEDEDTKKELTKSIEDELRDETPAIFLYHPKLIYLGRAPLSMSFPVYGISESSRFSSVEKWYKETERVWKYTYKQKAITALEKVLH